MSVVRLLSTVLAIFVTFLWAGFVVNAWQKNTMARQLAQTSSDKSSAEKIARDQSQEKTDTSKKAVATVKKKAVAEVKKTDAQAAKAKLDSTLDKADELARAANEEFSKRIKLAEAKILKPSSKEVKEVVDDKTAPEKKTIVSETINVSKATGVSKLASVTEKTKLDAENHESVVSKDGTVTKVTFQGDVKKDAVVSYGGIIYESEATIAAREAIASKIQNKTGATFLQPSSHIDVILGQGTAAIELLQEQPSLNSIITPVGGGGLLAGSALAAKYFGSSIGVYAGEPFNADDGYRSLQSGKIEYNTTVNTIADGLRTHLGDKNFPIIKSLVTDIIRVEEQEIISAMKLLWERLKIIIEPSCAVPFAALLKDKKTFAGKKVGIILSGGNVDLTNLPF